ncbi:MAG: ABC transporter permease [Vicinamibacteria bacterium]
MVSTSVRAPSAYVPGLIWTLVRTDFKARYHGTAGGYVWALLKPLCMFVVLLGVFSVIFSTDPNYNLNLIIGLFLWDFFSESTKAGIGSLHAKGFLITRAKFPNWIVVLTSSSNALFTLMLFLVLIIGYISAFRHALSLVEVVLLGYYLIAYFATVFGFSLASSVLFLRYRDLNQIWDLCLQAGFFVAPVIYPLHIIPEGLHFYLYLWMPTPFMQFMRSILVDGVIPTAKANLLLLGNVVVVLLVGVVLFRIFGPRAVEEL